MSKNLCIRRVFFWFIFSYMKVEKDLWKDYIATRPENVFNCYFKGKSI